MAPSEIAIGRPRIFYPMVSIEHKKRNSREVNLAADPSGCWLPNHSDQKQIVSFVADLDPPWTHQNKSCATRTLETDQRVKPSWGFRILLRFAALLDISETLPRYFRRFSTSEEKLKSFWMNRCPTDKSRSDCSIMWSSLQLFLPIALAGVCHATENSSQPIGNGIGTSPVICSCTMNQIGTANGKVLSSRSRIETLQRWMDCEITTVPRREHYWRITAIVIRITRTGTKEWLSSHCWVKIYTNQLIIGFLNLAPLRINYLNRIWNSDQRHIQNREGYRVTIVRLTSWVLFLRLTTDSL
jgi:hypothetical protein